MKTNLLCLLTAIFALAACSKKDSTASPKTQSNFPHSIYVANGSYLNKYESSIEGTFNSRSQIKWSFKMADETRASPIFSNGVVFVNAYDGFYALDAITSQQKWVFRHGNKIEEWSSPIISNGVVYFGSNDFNLYAIDIATGLKKWSFRIKGYFSEITFANGFIYFSNNTYDNNTNSLYCIDANTGQQKWIFTPDSQIGHIAQPTIVNGVVYVIYVQYLGSDSIGNSNLIAIDSNTGQKKWTFTLEYLRVSNVSTPIVENGIVYFSSNNSTGVGSYAVDANTGQEKWKVAYRYFDNATAFNGVIYGISEVKVYAIDGNTGREMWNFNADTEITSTPTLVDGMLYIQVRGITYALDSSTGLLKTKYYADNSGFDYSSPCIVTNKGDIYRGLGNIHP